MMKSISTNSRTLGAAFLFQFITSFSSGAFLRQAWDSPGNTGETLLGIASHTLIFRANLLLDLLTALGVTFLGVALFLTVRKHNEKLALTALGFYILEAALLAASRGQAFSLLRISQEYAQSGQPAGLLAIAGLALDSMEFTGSTLHMLVFCAGAIPFYYLLYRTGAVPRALALWGLITVLPCLLGSLVAVFGYQAPFLIYLPYVPFEFVVGLWILVKGIQEYPAAAVDRTTALAGRAL